MYYAGMIVDGKAMAEEVLARARARAESLPHSPKVVALAGENTPATKSYLRIKERAAGLAGCVFETRPLGADASDADAVIVQLPLPAGANRDEVLDAIPLEKDADVLSSAARRAFERSSINYSIYSSIYHTPEPQSEKKGDPFPLMPPVAGAVAEILAANGVNPEGKKAVVVGNGFLVGQPCATLLRHFGAEVTIADIDMRKEEFAAALGNADIIVSGAGAPGLITPDLIHDGVVLIDAGTSESGGKVVGDADPACASTCSLFTPVPGGVGPIAVAKLFENAVNLAKRKVANE